MKSLFDIIVTIVALIVLCPIFILISIIIKITSPGEVFYKGIRAGKNDINFKIYKFRTMVQDAENIGGPSTALNDFRLTKIGRFLRRYKLDELPQFINIIKGEMSLVGPRPQVVYYTDQYKGEFKLILSVKPGLTDLASLYFLDMDNVLGNQNVDEKYASEIEPIKNSLRLRYVKEKNFLLDIRILIETVFSIVGLKNITRLNIKP
ncbi:sugar transferase [Candidatus Pelagibacter bacterium]|nr:sugar transferase [Candidatus Pelagibacter bacterium]